MNDSNKVNAMGQENFCDRDVRVKLSEESLLREILRTKTEKIAGNGRNLIKMIFTLYTLHSLLLEGGSYRRVI